MASVYLLLGSNLGDRKQQLDTATRLISREVGPIITTSSVYKTAAWGKTDQPDFYNQVLQVDTLLTPHEMLSRLQEIETRIGRTRSEKWGPRVIDIDILLWENLVIESATLTIPHPGIAHRRFTLQPLAEIAGDLVHPVLKKKINELLEDCVDKQAVEEIFGNDLTP